MADSLGRDALDAQAITAAFAGNASATARELGVPCKVYLKLNIGNAQTEKCLDNALEIQRIYILKSAKGQGIGSAFMQIAIWLAIK